MPETNLRNLETTDFTNTFEEYQVPSETTDGVSSAKETEWTNTKWADYLGYYKEIPELAAAIDAKATWTVGKGFIADAETTLLLDQIIGFGKDTFNTILENLIRTYHIGGDAFAEIVTNEDGLLINLKPLDPSTITIVINDKGQIKRYEQKSKITKQKINEWQPEEIFHLARNRVADEFHGESIIRNLEKIIKARNQAMDDWSTTLHRYKDPLIIFEADTDDATTIAALKTKVNAARKDGENLIIPKGGVIPNQLNTSLNSTMNPQSWIQQLNQYFFQATGVPDIIVGGGSSSSFTEASAKIAYLAFQQTIEEEQFFIEEQCQLQLNIEIELEFPASLQNEVLSDRPRQDEVQPQEPQIQQNEQALEPNDQTAELEGRR